MKNFAKIFEKWRLQILELGSPNSFNGLLLDSCSPPFLKVPTQNPD
jgi:hypothetical protein